MKLHIMLTCVVMAVLAACPGCRMPVASLQLLDGLDEALSETSGGQDQVRAAISSQLDSQAQSLDAAFEADVRNLAGPKAPSPATTAPDELVVLLDDVLTAKRLYDARRTELDASRAGVAETFDRLGNNLSASRQMVGMLRRLVLQQNVLAGQADLALSTLLQRK